MWKSLVSFRNAFWATKSILVRNAKTLWNILYKQTKVNIPFLLFPLTLAVMIVGETLEYKFKIEFSKKKLYSKKLPTNVDCSRKIVNFKKND